jgi:membrane protein implicated in regulation of membrane protease activity
VNSWVWSAVVTGIICVLYVAIGRRYVHRRIAASYSKTNIDTIVGKTGIVQKDIEPGKHGLVRVENEEWRARAEGSIKEGETVTVTGIKGVTIAVKKTEGSKTE